MKTNAPLKRSPISFFTLVFAFALPFWLLDIKVKHIPIPINLPISALQFVCPLIAAVVLVSREKKRGSVMNLLKSAFDAKRIRYKIWYIPIILLMPLIMILSYGIIYLMGRPLPTHPYIPLLMLPLFFVVFFLAAACEEIGWMGYAVGPMQDRWSAFTASLLLGFVWALWHVIPELSANSPAWVAGQFFSTVLLRVLLVWLYNNTGKSVFAAILFHDMVNVSEFAFPNYGSYYDPFISDAILVVIVAIIMLLWGPKTLACWKYAHPSKRRSNREKKGEDAAAKQACETGKRCIWRA